MNIHPTGNRILLELDESEATFADGLLVVARVPDRDGYYKMEPQRGRVLAIGPKVEDVEVGDYLVCNKYNGTRLPPRDWDGRKLLLIRETHVFCKVAEDWVDMRFGKSHADNRPGRLRNR